MKLKYIVLNTVEFADQPNLQSGDIVEFQEKFSANWYVVRRNGYKYLVDRNNLKKKEYILSWVHSVLLRWLS